MFSCRLCLLQLAGLPFGWMTDGHGDNWWRMILIRMKCRAMMFGGPFSPHSLLSLFRFFYFFNYFVFGLGEIFFICFYFKNFLLSALMTKKNIFLKKEKSVGFKPVESSLKIADLRMQLLLLKMHACKRANSEVLDIQAPTLLTAGRRWKKKKKKKDILK